MVRADRRVVVVVDEPPSAAAPRWLLYQWAVGWETDYAAPERLGELGCGVMRGGVGRPLAGSASFPAALPAGTRTVAYAEGAGHYARRLGTLNHFLSIGGIGAPPLAQRANAEEAVRRRAAACIEEWGGRVPNLVAVDFWSMGGVVPAVAAINGVA
eukprot:gene15745-13773_t